MNPAWLCNRVCGTTECSWWSTRLLSLIAEEGAEHASHPHTSVLQTDPTVHQ